MLRRLTAVGRPKTEVSLGAWGDVYAWLARHAPSFDGLLFGLALALFALTRLVDLEGFPIYFFTDEAIQTDLAADLVDKAFRDPQGHLFPTSFLNDFQFLMEIVSVYAHIIPYELFGYSVFASRATAVLFAISGAVAAGLTLREIFKIRFWWLGVLLLTATPAWFFHSRQAWGATFGVSLYLWFLYFYMRYRYGHRPSLFVALVFLALTSYSYQSLEIVAATTGVLLLLVDFPYHWRNRPTAFFGVLLVAVLLLPYLRFQLEHPGEFEQALRLRESYWLLDTPFTEKIGTFLREYIAGLNPAYWFDPNDTHDLIRHRMKGYGHILLPTLPFLIVGLLVCFWKIRSPAHRILLVALVAAPTGGAMVEVNVLRTLVIVVPAALLTAIGLAFCLELLAKRVAYRPLAVGVFTLLAAVSIYMMRDALANGGTWYHDYGLYGMQWGSRQVFGEAKKSLEESPETTVLISPTWANGANNLFTFFLHDQPRAQLGNYLAYDQSKLELNDNMLFVMPSEEYQQVVNNPKFANVRVEKTIKYPDGRDGFFFVRFNYAPDADAIIAAANAARREPIQEDITLDGQTISTLHSPFDIGVIAAVFDGDINTLARTEEANPAIFELTFPAPRPLTGLSVTTSTLDNMTVTAKIYSDETSDPLVYTQGFVNNVPPDLTVDLNFDPVPPPAKKIRIEVKNWNASEFDHIHVYEIVMR